MHRSRAAIASSFAVLLLVASVSPALGATTQEYQRHKTAAENARKQAAAAEKTANRLAAEVADLDGEIERFQAQAAALEPKIAAATARTQRILADVQRLTAQVDLVKQEIEATQAEYTRQQELLSERVASTYRQGDWFYFDLLLGSTDIGSLIQRTEFVSRIIRSNNDLAGDLEATERSLGRSKSKLDRTLASVKLKKQEAAAVESELRSLRRDKQRAAEERETAQSRKSELMQDNKKNAARLRALAEAEEQESARIAQELAAAGHGSGLYAGTMAWPVPASHRITSPFGYRICPFHGQELHPGIDIGRPIAGADWPVEERAIVAAGSGTVIYAGYRGGYGNTVMIDHGNGVVTLYAHQLEGGIRVSSGQSVGKGDRIGTVGSTGNSTGPHLHFEVRVNGEPKNPMGYF